MWRQDGDAAPASQAFHVNTGLLLMRNCKQRVGPDMRGCCSNFDRASSVAKTLGPRGPRGPSS